MCKRILVVDDDDVARELTKRLLVQDGYSCELAENGREAWQKLDSGEHFDFIVSDYQMPEMNGLELLRLVRLNLRFARIRFLLISGVGTVSKDDKTPLHDVCKQFDAEFRERPFLGLGQLVASTLGVEIRQPDDS